MSYNQATGRSKYSTVAITLIPSVLATILLLASACTPTRDAQTITQLESARDQVHTLYDTFTGSKIDGKQVAAVQATLAGIHSYEMSKGKSNILMAKQVEAIQSMFESHLAQRKKASRWSGTHKNNKKELIGLAFQTAIATENEKNE